MLFQIKMSLTSRGGNKTRDVKSQIPYGFKLSSLSPLLHGEFFKSRIPFSTEVSDLQNLLFSIDESKIPSMHKYPVHIIGIWAQIEEKSLIY